MMDVRAITAFLPARSPRVSVATAFLSHSIFFFGSTRLLLEGLWQQEDFKRKSMCSFNAKTVFAQAIVFVTRACASDVVVIN